MRNDPMEQKLKTAAEHLTPDVLDRILADCAKEPKGEILYMENISDPRSRNNNWIKVLSLGTAACMMIGGLFWWNRYRALNYTVEMDVNPSIELRVNKAEKVISAEALNKDAEIILEDMKLKGVDVDVATNAIDFIHTTAASHGRVFIVEVMGHKVGQLTLHAGIAGGADIILIPEIPYSIDSICKAIEARNKQKKGFTILAVAEGAIPKERAEMSKKDLKKFMETYKYPTVSYEIADQLTKRLGTEVRVTVPGHTQRGGSPCPYDRVLSTRLGAAAAQAIVDDAYGCMIGIVNGECQRIPLEESAGKLKFVDPNSSIISEAKMIGISFGD